MRTVHRPMKCLALGAATAANQSAKEPLFASL